jgi:hypothetical protein
VGGSQSNHGESYAHHYRQNHYRQNHFHMASPDMSSFSSGSSAVLLMNRRRWTPKDPLAFRPALTSGLALADCPSMLYYVIPNVKIKRTGLEK